MIYLPQDFPALQSLRQNYARRVLAHSGPVPSEELLLLLELLLLFRSASATEEEEEEEDDEEDG